MKKKIIGIFVCILMISCAIPVCSTVSELNVKKSLYAPVSLYKDHVRAPLYTRSLQDIISGKPIQVLEGTRPLLVILADLINTKPNASHTTDYYNKLLFGLRPSFSDYYSEVSYGKFTYSCADILGWYKIPVTKRWALSHPSEFLVKAVKVADKDFDFASYDTNNDEVVTNEELTLIVVFSSRVGFFGLNWWADDEIRTKDGVFLEQDYSILDEWEPITTFAHELGHDIGLPDLYDYDGDSNGTGDYCTMSNRNAGYPHFSAWCKIQLGWIIPTVVTTSGIYTLHDIETHPEALIVCDLQHSALEYFLIENRYKGTSYDSIKGGKWYMPGLLGLFYPYYNYISDLPDEGIVIYHIDDNQSLRWWESGGLYANVNDIEEHKAVDVECADSPSSHFKNADDLDSMKNGGDKNDLWDSTTYDFTDNSVPCNATWYDGTPSGFTIRDFSAIRPTMTMKISVTYENQPPNIPTITGKKSGKVNTSYTYEFSTMDPEGGFVYYYIDWGDGSSTGWTTPKTSGSTQEILHAWAEKGTYPIKIKAKDLFGAESDWGILEVKMAYSSSKPILPYLRLLFHWFPNAFLLLRQPIG